MITHLGRNPTRGGSPPSDRRMIIMVNLVNRSNCDRLEMFRIQRFLDQRVRNRAVEMVR